MTSLGSVVELSRGPYVAKDGVVELVVTVDGAQVLVVVTLDRGIAVTGSETLDIENSAREFINVFTKHERVLLHRLLCRLRTQEQAAEVIPEPTLDAKGRLRFLLRVGQRECYMNIGPTLAPCGSNWRDGASEMSAAEFSAVYDGCLA